MQIDPILFTQCLCAAAFVGLPVFVYATRDAGPVLWLGALCWWLLILFWTVGMRKGGAQW